jgi:type IV secretory pathway VirB2 component (pilin)
MINWVQRVVTGTVSFVLAIVIVLTVGYLMHIPVPFVLLNVCS